MKRLAILVVPFLVGCSPHTFQTFQTQDQYKPADLRHRLRDQPPSNEQETNPHEWWETDPRRNLNDDYADAQRYLMDPLNNSHVPEALSSISLASGSLRAIKHLIESRNPRDPVRLGYEEIRGTWIDPALEFLRPFFYIDLRDGAEAKLRLSGDELMLQFRFPF